MAHTCAQTAAGVFDYLKEYLSFYHVLFVRSRLTSRRFLAKNAAEAVLLDLSSEAIQMLRNVYLAEAQQCVLQKVLSFRNHFSSSFTHSLTHELAHTPRSLIFTHTHAFILRTLTHTHTGNA